MTDLLKSYFGIESVSDSNELRAIVTAKILALDRELQSLITPLLALLDAGMENREWCNLEPAQQLRLSLEAVIKLLIRQSQNQPLLVAFDDLQSHDAVTQSLLDGLVETLPRARILLVVSYRPECMSSEHFGQLAWQFKRMSGSSGLKVQAAIAC